MKSFVVIGMGRFGQEVAMRLYELGNEVLAIDEDEECIQSIADKVTYSVTGDAKNIDVLRHLGVKNYDTAIVAIGSDLAASVVITLNLKELGVKNVICKAENEQYKTALIKIGADQAMIPERMIAAKLAESLSSSKVLDYISLSDDFSIVEIQLPSAWASHTIAELNVNARYHVVLLAIKRGAKMLIPPKANEPLEEGDVVLALGENLALETLKKL